MPLIRVHLIAALLALLNIPSAVFGQVPVGRFVDIKPVAPLDEGDARDCCHPVLDNELEIWFSSRNRSDRTSWDIYRANRAAADQPFSDPVPVATNINTTSTDAASYLTPDGLTLIMYSNRSGSLGGNDLYSATRETTDDDFANVSSFGDLVNSAADDQSGVLSHDGLNLYFASDRQSQMDLWTTTRTSVDVPFGPAEPVANVNSNAYDDGPMISRDGLHLFFFSFRSGQQAELFVASRNDVQEPFGVPVDINRFSLGSSINTDGVDILTPYLSRNWPEIGSKLYFTRAVNPNGLNPFSLSDWDLYEATWVPEPCGAVLLASGLVALLAVRRGVS